MKYLFLIISLVFSQASFSQHHINDSCFVLVDPQEKKLQDTMSKAELMKLHRLYLLPLNCDVQDSATLMTFNVLLVPKNGPATVYMEKEGFTEALIFAIADAPSGSSILIERARFNPDENVYFLRPQKVVIR